MRAHRLLLFLMFSVAPSCYAQTVPVEQASTPDPYANCAGFKGWIKNSSWGGAFEMHGGCLTTSNGSVRLDPSPFDFPIGDLASFEKKKFKYWKGFQFKLKNGKKIEFYPFYDKRTSGPDEAAAQVEKAIRDLASQNGVILK
jgi:hypothetical protein